MGADSNHVATVIVFPAEYSQYKVGVVSATEALRQEEDKRMDEVSKFCKIITSLSY